ncbi:acyl-CoA thioesterase [Rhodococcus sp. ABRD24]|uniref:acyl-CoA thioesterase n=1 Tax=Rhodococcus sp. ABRD24 TaxID=2507582 RepID=UPI00103A76FE|nr:thioesterase family protein [Rhodococcus sp. ABRD24]QBJ98518.1 acyl-CoA thioesterase [Rhodococcus sp. ABRD24]
MTLKVSEEAVSSRAVIDPRAGFHTKVVVRWSDMDAFQHINHARMVTLLEEARIPWLFEDAAPTVTLRDGAVIVDLHVRYRGQLRHEDSPLDVLMWVEQVRAVDFTIAYEVRPGGASAASAPAIVASTQIAAFDIDTQRLRRLTAPEREFLERWKHG